MVYCSKVCASFFLRMLTAKICAQHFPGKIPGKNFFRPKKAWRRRSTFDFAQKSCGDGGKYLTFYKLTGKVKIFYHICVWHAPPGLSWSTSVSDTSFGLTWSIPVSDTPRIIVIYFCTWHILPGNAGSWYKSGFPACLRVWHALDYRNLILYLTRLPGIHRCQIQILISGLPGVPGTLPD